IHHRLFAAFQPQVRLRAEVDPQWDDRQAGERPREPAHHARPRKKDQRTRQALARRNGVHARSRLRAVVPRAGETGARLFPGALRRNAAHDRPVMVTPEHARMVMEINMAADLSAERNESVTLPLKGSKPARAAA